MTQLIIVFNISSFVGADTRNEFFLLKMLVKVSWILDFGDRVKGLSVEGREFRFPSFLSLLVVVGTGRIVRFDWLGASNCVAIQVCRLNTG